MCDFLGNVYEKVFDEKFVYKGETCMQMQDAVYLLEKMGMNIDDYNFIWYEHGLFSLSLNDDILAIMLNPVKSIEFTDYANSCLNKIKSLVDMHSKTAYSITHWLDAVASLNFMIDRMCMNDKKALAYLKEIKPFLNNDLANKKALSICKNL